MLTCSISAVSRNSRRSQSAASRSCALHHVLCSIALREKLHLHRSSDPTVTHTRPCIHVCIGPSAHMLHPQHAVPVRPYVYTHAHHTRRLRVLPDTKYMYIRVHTMYDLCTCTCAGTTGTTVFYQSDLMATIHLLQHMIWCDCCLRMAFISLHMFASLSFIPHTKCQPPREKGLNEQD